eukprot:m51a1_g11530 putative U3 small nucleolar RNA-associated protein (933) ;mRNA; f:5639-9178
MADLASFLAGDEGDLDDVLAAESSGGEDAPKKKKMSKRIRREHQREEAEELRRKVLSAVGAHPANVPWSRDHLDAAENYEESEFNIPMPEKGTVDIGDLTAGMRGDGSTTRELEKQIRQLSARDAPHVVQKALPDVVVDRLVRQEAYEREVYKVTTEFEHLVEANRTNPHLQFPDPAPVKLKTMREIAEKTASAPKTELEARVGDILRSSGVEDERAIESFEKQLEIGLTPEMVKKRQEELAKLQRLSFYHEIKAKRQARIKSKRFRKIQRKTRQRLEEEAAEVAEVDPEEAERVRERIERDRIKERVTLKHQNTSKWVRRLKDKGLTNIPGLRRAIEDQVRIGKDLERKMETMEDVDADEYSEEKLREAAQEQLKMLEEVEADQSKKGIVAMKFMQDERLRQRMELRKFIEDFDDTQREELEEAQRQVEEEENARKAERAKTMAMALKNAEKETPAFVGGSAVIDAVGTTKGARTRVAGAITLSVSEEAQAQAEALFEEPATWKTVSDVTEAKKKREKKEKKEKKRSRQTEAEAEAEDGAHEAEAKEPVKIEQAAEPEEPAKKRSKKPRSALSSFAMEEKTEGSGAPAANPWLATPAPKPQEAASAAAAPKAEEEDADPQMEVSESVAKTQEDDVVAGNGDDDAVDSEAPKKLMEPVDELQQKLVREAFGQVDADIEAEFKKEKSTQAIAEAGLDAPVDNSDTLPGWGYWAGVGRKTPKWVEKKRKAKVEKREQDIEQAKLARRDASMAHVVLTEGGAARLAQAKYLVPQAPREFASTERYEMALNVPLGSEWQPNRTRRDLIRPAVTVKPGAIIAPIKAHKFVAVALVSASAKCKECELNSVASTGTRCENWHQAFACLKAEGCDPTVTLKKCNDGYSTNKKFDESNCTQSQMCRAEQGGKAGKDDKGGLASAVVPAAIALTLVVGRVVL